MKLNLGCGQKYLEGYVNCDVSPRVKADLNFDLDVFPYPFEPGVVDEVFMDNVFDGIYFELQKAAKQTAE